MQKFLVIALLFQLSAYAQVPSMLKDMSPGNTSTSFGDIATLPGDNILMLTQSSLTSGSGLWVSDGSSGGTKQLRSLDVRSQFGTLNSKKFFGATGTNSVFGLWMSDGTSANTDSIPLPGLTDITTFHTVNNKIVFFGLNASNNTEVWTSDGTGVGTHSMLSLSAAEGYTVINNLLYFSGTTSTEGKELYRSDGTTSGTFLLKDVWSGGGSSFSVNPVAGAFNGVVFMVMNDGTSGQELWKTDGTTNGTALLKDIYPGTGGSGMYANNFKLGPNGVYFMANNQTNGSELWYSDGTGTNTNLVYDIVPGTGSSSVNDITFVNNNAFFYVSGTIYKTNGTSAGTSTLNVLKENPNGPYHYIYDWKLRLYNNDLYFVSVISNNFQTAYDTIVFNKVDQNLNRYSAARLPHSIIAAAGGIQNQFMNATTVVNGSHFIYFFKTDNSQLSIAIFNPATGNHKLHYQMGSTSTFYLTHPFDYPVAGNKLYLPFTKNGISPGYLDLANDSIYPLTSGGIVYDCGSGPSAPYWTHKGYTLNNKTYFMAYESAYGLEFFGTDFTMSGTARLKDINPGSGNFDNGNSMNNCTSGIWFVHQTSTNFYFGADDGSSGFELWSLYNSPGNPVAVSEVPMPSELRIFPNPASNYLNIGYDGIIKSTAVYDVLGGLVKTSNANENNRLIDLGTLKAGIYIIDIETEYGSFTKKFIKQ